MNQHKLEGDSPIFVERKSGQSPRKVRRPRKPRRPVEIPTILQILVECRSEDQQRELFLRLKEEGYSCRVLTL
jgi:hypothetical protein